jgi:hypothetical protein
MIDDYYAESAFAIGWPLLLAEAGWPLRHIAEAIDYFS